MCVREVGVVSESDRWRGWERGRDSGRGQSLVIEVLLSMSSFWHQNINSAPSSRGGLSKPLAAFKGHSTHLRSQLHARLVHIYTHPSSYGVQHQRGVKFWSVLIVLLFSALSHCSVRFVQLTSHTKSRNLSYDLLKPYYFHHRHRPANPATFVGADGTQASTSSYYANGCWKGP